MATRSTTALQMSGTLVQSSPITSPTRAAALVGNASRVPRHLNHHCWQGAELRIWRRLSDVARSDCEPVKDSPGKAESCAVPVAGLMRVTEVDSRHGDWVSVRVLDTGPMPVQAMSTVVGRYGKSPNDGWHIGVSEVTAACTLALERSLVIVKSDAASTKHPTANPASPPET